MRVLIDTNILVRIANGPGDPHFSPATDALEVLRGRGHIPCLVPQVIYEFWAVATRPVNVNGLGMTTSEARKELKSFRPPLFQLLQDERAIFRKWEDLTSRYDISGKVTYDARLVAAMLRHNVTHVLTLNDQHFARFAGIDAVPPNEASAI